MTHACALFIARTVSTLRAESFSRPAECNEHIVPEVYFSWNAGVGDVRVDVSSGPGIALGVRAGVAKPSEWFTLSFPLGEGAFQKGDVIGLVHEMRSDAEADFSAFIRSQSEAGPLDTVLQEPLRSGPERGIRTLLHTVSEADGLPYADRFHTLIIPLPQRDFELDLLDLSLFVLPAARGVKARGPTLASVGG